MHGKTKKMPGPRDPPLRSRPNLKMTARSYSCTTLKQTKREKGRVTSMRSQEKPVKMLPHTPTPSAAEPALVEREWGR